MTPIERHRPWWTRYAHLDFERDRETCIRDDGAVLVRPFDGSTFRDALFDIDAFDTMNPVGAPAPFSWDVSDPPTVYDTDYLQSVW